MGQPETASIDQQSQECTSVPLAIGGREAFGSDVTTGYNDLVFRMKKKHKTRETAAPAPALEAPVADTHVHLAMLRDPAFNVARAGAYGVGFLCCISNPYEDADLVYSQIDAWFSDAQERLNGLLGAPDALASLPWQLPDWTGEVAPVVPRFRIACGCHPHDAHAFDDVMEQNLRAHLKDPRTCIVGEVGLDYHYDYSPRPVQREVFRRQIALAHESGLPIALHLREAHDEALEIMDEEGFPEAGTILHCFNLGADVLAPWVERDCYVAVGGAVTFGSSDDLRSALPNIPRERFLFETDGPFMAPAPFRGCEAGPEHTIFTAEAICAELGLAPGEERTAFLQQVYENTLRLLDRGPTPWQNA